jgi:hypothetical protein
MTARFTVVAQDRSPRWTLVPGVASTRQLEIRNDSDAAVECHLRVERPPSASASPAVFTIQPHHARSADVIFLANWSPAQEGALEVSLRDPQGQRLAVFNQQLVAADSSDCSLGLEIKEPVVAAGVLAGFKLWLTIASRAATPRRFEIDFVPHPSLRFPERTTVTLAPGEATAFEVPVEWNRLIRDLHFWNHPSKIEAFVPTSNGRRTAMLPWETIQQRLDQYLTEDDRVARIPQTVAATQNASSPVQTPGQLRYTELVELKKLEQAVVGAVPQRIAATSDSTTGAAQLEGPPRARLSVAALATTGFALLALAMAAFLFLRPPVVHPASAPVHVTQPLVPTPVLITLHQATPKHALTGPVAKPVWTSVASAQHPAVAGVESSRETAPVATATQPPKTVALAPAPAQPLHRSASVDRNAVVELGGVDAAYTSGGRAVSVAWSNTAQASATVQVVDLHGKIIASRSVPGGRSTATVRLPRGYHGSVSVQVIANGYHGERVVQSTALAPGG